MEPPGHARMWTLRRLQQLLPPRLWFQTKACLCRRLWRRARRARPRWRRRREARRGGARGVRGTRRSWLGGRAPPAAPPRAPVIGRRAKSVATRKRWGKRKVFRNKQMSLAVCPSGPCLGSKKGACQSNRSLCSRLVPVRAARSSHLCGRALARDRPQRVEQRRSLQPPTAAGRGRRGGGEGRRGGGGGGGWR